MKEIQKELKAHSEAIGKAEVCWRFGRVMAAIEVFTTYDFSDFSFASKFPGWEISAFNQSLTLMDKFLNQRAIRYIFALMDEFTLDDMLMELSLNQQAVFLEGYSYERHKCLGPTNSC